MLSRIGIVGSLLLLVITAFAWTATGKDEEPEFATAPCTDSEGASTGFFCQPLSAKGKLVKACDDKKPKDLATCQSQGARAYCSRRGYSQVLSYAADAKGNLSELVCSRQTITTVAAAAPVEEWQPMFNVNIMGYDHREFAVANANDWQSCKRGCDADGNCQAWTLVPERKMCYMKWDGRAELLQSDPCCITGVKGMASAGSAASQKKVRTPEELRRLGQRTKGAAEDEVGRRAEDAVRRGIGDILN